MDARPFLMQDRKGEPEKHTLAKNKKALDKRECYGIITPLTICVVIRGVAQFGSVLEWGSRGREFESRHSDQKRA